MLAYIAYITVLFLFIITSVHTHIHSCWYLKGAQFTPNKQECFYKLVFYALIFCAMQWENFVGKLRKTCPGDAIWRALATMSWSLPFVLRPPWGCARGKGRLLLRWDLFFFFATFLTLKSLKREELLQKPLLQQYYSSYYQVIIIFAFFSLVLVSSPLGRFTFRYVLNIFLLYV